MVLQRRDGVDLYDGREVGVYELREARDGPMVREFGMDLYDALLEGSHYRAAVATLLPGGMPLSDVVADGRDGALLFRVLMPHPPAAPVPEVIDL